MTTFQRRELPYDARQVYGVDLQRVCTVQDSQLRALLGSRLVLRPIPGHRRPLRPYRSRTAPQAPVTATPNDARGRTSTTAESVFHGGDDVSCR